MGLALGCSKAIVLANSRACAKIAITNGKREFYTTLKTISAAGELIPPFIIWANKIHTMGFYGREGVHNEKTSFALSPSRYMDDELGLKYLIHHFDKYTMPSATSTASTTSTSSTASTASTASTTSTASTSTSTSASKDSLPWRLLIVDEHSSYVSYQVIKAALDCKI